MNKLQKRIQGLTTQQIKESASALMGTFSEDADITMSALLDELTKRLPTKEFVEFCDSL